MGIALVDQPELGLGPRLITETHEVTEVYFIAGILEQILKITKQLRRWILNSFYTVCWYYIYYTLLYIDFISSLGLCCSLILVVYYLNEANDCIMNNLL